MKTTTTRAAAFVCAFTLAATSSDAANPYGLITDVSVEDLGAILERFIASASWGASPVAIWADGTLSPA